MPTQVRDETYRLTNKDWKLRGRLHSYGIRKLARATGLSPATISRWVNGEKPSPYGTIVSILEAAGEDANKILGKD